MGVPNEILEKIKNETGIDIKEMARVTPYSAVQLIEQVRAFESIAHQLRMQKSIEKFPVLFASFIDQVAESQKSIEQIIMENLEPLVVIEKTKLPIDHKVTLVASPDLTARYQKLYQLSVENSLDAFNLYCSWFEIKSTSSTWLIEVHLLSKGEEDLGFFIINKDLMGRSASLLSFIRKEFRKKGLMSGCLQFIANRVFNEWGFLRMEAQAFSTNEQGVKFYSKYMVEEGISREVTFFNGNSVNRHNYALLRREVEWCKEDKIFRLIKDRKNNN